MTLPSFIPIGTPTKGQKKVQQNNAGALADGALTLSTAPHFAERCGAADSPSRRRDCHFDDTPSSSLLKHLLKVEGGAVK